MQPIISIIIPCYNGEKYLRETLDCLQKQTIDAWECIVVNDGSTDGSLEIIKEYSEKDSRYKYFDQPNQGPAAARNFAVNHASGVYVLPLDADDIIAPSYLEKAVSYLEIHTDTKLVYCKAHYFGEKNGPFVLPEYSYDRLIWENPIFCSCVFRKSDFDIVGGYDIQMKGALEDWEFLIRLLKESDKVYCIPEGLFYYRQHTGTRNEDVKKRQIACRYIVRKHFERYEDYCLNIHQYKTDSENYQKWFYEIYNSKSFQLGQVLLAPLKCLFKFLGQK